MATKNALVVGASRGLGLGLTTRLLERGWRVTATSRHAGGDLEALATQWDGALTVETVDTNDAASVDALHKRLSDKVFDLIFVNAGITHDRCETVADEMRSKTLSDSLSRNAVTEASSLMSTVSRVRAPSHCAASASKSSPACRLVAVTCHPRSRKRVVRPRPKPCLLYTSPSPRDRTRSRMPSSA